MIPQAVLMRSGLKIINTARSRAAVNAAKPKAVHNDVKRNRFHDVKASTCWVWNLKNRVTNHVSKHNITTTGAEISTGSPKVKTDGYFIKDIAAKTLVNIRRSATKAKDKGKFHFPGQLHSRCFVVDPRVPLILRRPFLRTARALIDVYGEELTLRVNDEAITFKVGQTSRYSYNNAKSVNRIDLRPSEKTTSLALWDVCYRRYGLSVYVLLRARSKEGIVLGHKISKSGIEVDKDKVDVIAKLLSNFRNCVEGFLAFNILKKKLTEAPILVAPDWDLPFEIMCDASDYAVGAVLGQQLLAVVYAFEKFRPYLALSKTIVYTDHSALKYLLTKQDAKPRLLRWILQLQEFDVIIRDKKGVENLTADHLSRHENLYQDVLENKEITETFPLETLDMVTFRGDSSTPWFSDIANYHAGNFIVKGMSSQQKKKIL
ncbi:reverse transcriptase domain-containing protein [Tanacetum coccineum]